MEKYIVYKISAEQKEMLSNEAKRLGLNLSALSRFAVIKFLKENAEVST
jgi:hypothetical protein